MSFWNGITQKKQTPFWGGMALAEPFENTTAGIAKNTVLGLPKAAVGVGKTIGSFLNSLGQTSQRAYAALGGALSGHPLTPSTQFQNDLYGTTPEFNLEQAQQKAKMSIAPGTKAYEEAIKTKPITLRGVGEEFSGLQGNPIAPVVGLASGAADLIPGGKVTKTAAVSILKGIGDAKMAEQTLSRTLGIAESVAKKYGGRVARLTDKNLIAAEIDKAVKESQDLIQIAKRTATTAKNTVKTVAKATETGFQGFTDLSTKLLEKLKGRDTVSKQFIADATNMPDLKQPEKDLFRRLLADEGDTVSVKEFANRVKSELLPLEVGSHATGGETARYESISLPDELRGEVADYGEKVYTSPIKTSAGGVHFGDQPIDNYFAHTRVEDLPGKKVAPDSPEFDNATFNRNGGSDFHNQGTTRRVIELQSDLFQKGRLEGENDVISGEALRELQKSQEGFDVPKDSAGRTQVMVDGKWIDASRAMELHEARAKELAPLEPYRNTWHERVIREEVKQAAKDGKTKLQFPTGDTAMQIEGLGNSQQFHAVYPGENGRFSVREIIRTPEELQVGKEIQGHGQNWIITDVLGDGKFEAVPKNRYEYKPDEFYGTKAEHNQMVDAYSETFDISGKVDTENPIYKFYEKTVGKYLKNKYGAELITDPQGVKWWEVNVKPEYAKAPVEAYGVSAGVEPEYDENGKIVGSKVDPAKAALGVGAAAFAKKIRPTDLAKEAKQLGKQTGRMAHISEVLAQSDSKLREAAQGLSSLSKVSSESKTPPLINLDRLSISEPAKDLITSAIEEVKPRIEEKVGKVLSNQEVIKTADATSNVLKKAIGIDDTKEWAAALLKTREQFAKMAETGIVDKQFLDTLTLLKSLGTDAGRKLQSFSIKASPKDITLKQQLLDAILDSGANADEILKAAEGVDFNDFKQAAEFYRKFIKPKATEWLDLLRYNSMLSSPLTHIVNASSNLINSLTLAPLEKATRGAVDMFASAVTRKDRQAFAGEAPAYVKGYLSNIEEAGKRFGETLAGTREITNLDTRNIPLAEKGAAKVAENVLSVPMKFLEASDQFFTALTEAGEKASLAYRESKGVNVPDVETAAKDSAAYRLFRQDLFPEGQGTVLDAVDHLTQALYSLRSSENPIVSTIFKFTVPFLRTPINIVKQGMEYSPIGYITAFGSGNKLDQITKAAMGTAVFGAAASLLGSNRLTWSEPIPDKDKNAFRDAGMQPYSVKIGDNWVSYQKLPPGIAFPLSIVAMIDEAQKQGKVGDNTADLILSSIAKYGSFLSDQSYAKSVGDLMSALQGGESDAARLISNYPQQLIPYRALGGWLTRLIDHVQRKPDPDGDFVEKQVQLLMQNIPGLSQNVPARKNQKGEDIEAQKPITNSFSPFRISTPDATKEKSYENTQKFKKFGAEKTAEGKVLSELAERTFAELSAMPPEEANRRLTEIDKDNPALADKIDKLLEQEQLGRTYEDTAIYNLGVENGARASAIADKINELKTPQEKQALYDEYVDKKLITKAVDKQLDALLK